MSSYPAHLEKRAEAIKAARLAADELHATSELLRARIDNAQLALTEATMAGAIDQETYEKLVRRPERFRELRNAMECFAFKCKVDEVMEKAWRELP